MKKVVGIAILLGGIAMILISQYIKHQVLEGEGRVASAQSQVDTSKKLFSVDPLTEEVGKGLTDPAQRRIDRGRRDIAHYQSMSRWLQIGGIILIVLGAGVMIFAKKKKK